MPAAAPRAGGVLPWPQNPEDQQVPLPAQHPGKAGCLTYFPGCEGWAKDGHLALPAKGALLSINVHLVPYPAFGINYDYGDHQQPPSQGERRKKTEFRELPSRRSYDQAQVLAKVAEARAVLRDGMRKWGERFVCAGVSEGADVLWAAARAEALEGKRVPPVVLILGGSLPYVFERDPSQAPGPFYGFRDGAAGPEPDQFHRPLVPCAWLTLARNDLTYRQGIDQSEGQLQFTTQFTTYLFKLWGQAPLWSFGPGPKVQLLG
jgi:hypothetical protein